LRRINDDAQHAQIWKANVHGTPRLTCIRCLEDTGPEATGVNGIRCNWINRNRPNGNYSMQDQQDRRVKMKVTVPDASVMPERT
jgi:hypothetical protein